MPHRFASDTLDALVFLMPQGTLVCSQTAGLFEPEHPIMPDMHQLLYYNPWLLSIAPHSIGRPGNTNYLGFFQVIVMASQPFLFRVRCNRTNLVIVSVSPENVCGFLLQRLQNRKCTVRHHVQPRGSAKPNPQGSYKFARNLASPTGRQSSGGNGCNVYAGR